MPAQIEIPDRESKIAAVKKFHEQGKTAKQIADRIGVTSQWVSWRLREMGVESQRRIYRKKLRDRHLVALKVAAIAEPERQPVFVVSAKERGRIGDLRDSVDCAYWRVCG